MLPFMNDYAKILFGATLAGLAMVVGFKLNR